MDFKVILKLLATLCLSCNFPETLAQTCGDIGTFSPEFTESREQNFFLNTQDPAPCDGTVTQFQYCYYLTSQFSISHRFTFAIYRETSEGSNTYNSVSDAFTTGTSISDHGSDPFSCKVFDPGQTIPIQAGDVIGACIYDPTDGIFRIQLDVVGQNADTSFLMRAADNTGCGTSLVPSSISGLSRADGFVLHVNASIVPNPTTAPPPVVTSVTTPTLSAISTSSLISEVGLISSSAFSSSVLSTNSVRSTALEISAAVSVVSSAIVSTAGPITSSETMISSISSTSALSTPEAVSTSVIEQLTTHQMPTITAVTSSLTSILPIATPIVTSFLAPTTEIIASLRSTATMVAMSVSNVPTSSPLISDTIASSTVELSVSTGTLVEVFSTEVPVIPTASSTISVNASFSTQTQIFPMSSVMDDIIKSTNVIVTSQQPLSTMFTTSSSPISSLTVVVVSSAQTGIFDMKPTITPKPPITNTETDTMATTAPTTEPSTGGMTVIIVAVAVGIAVLVVTVSIVIFTWWLRKKKRRKQLGIANVLFSGHNDPLRERVMINDAYSDSGTTTKEDLGQLYGNGTYSLAMDMYDVPRAVTKQSPLFDSAYAESGPDEEVRATFTPNEIKFSKLLEEDEQRNDIYDELSPYQAPACEEDDIYGQLKSWGAKSIYQDEIEIVGHLGSGQYGSVDRGVWKRQGTKPVDVALKSLTKTSEEDRVKFLQEAAIMAQFRHPNVIMLHGIVIDGTPTLIVAEIATNGDLRSFLRTLRDKTKKPGLAKLLLRCSNHVAQGMEYLSTKGFVHRDLAARNVLVTEDYTCKIADFGMSRDLADENYYVSQGKDKIPVKWTAPEAIHYKKYSTASDVWAYGCLLYEIWSVGHKPFEGVTNPETIQLIDRGKRLSPPPGCPKKMYELMINCWHPQTMVRPTFQILALTYSGEERTLLGMPKKEVSTHPRAGVLGATLEAGENMYTQLQHRYRNYDNKAVTETDDDYFTPTLL